LKSLTSLTFVLALLIVSAANAKQPQEKKLGSINCAEQSDVSEGDGGILGEVDIKLDGGDQVVEIKVKRTKTDTQEAVKLVFNAKNSKFKHETIPGKVMDTDEETHQPIYDWGIEKIEMIEAESADGNKIRLHLNDHNYAGTPGTTVFYTVNGKSFDSGSEGNMAICDGKMRFPRK